MGRLTVSGTGEARSDVTIKDILNKLRFYEDLEEQGKLIKLPCRVGDTVYNMAPLRDGKEYHETIVDKIIIDKDGMFLHFEFGLMKNINCIGDSLLMSKEAAEKALREFEEERKSCL